MALDRDLAVALARESLAPGAAGWETTAATGVRGLRLLNESGRLSRFRLSEASDRTFPVLARNCARYPGAEAVHEDARRPREGPGGWADWVDIDPYGTPLPYLDAAWHALAPDSVLAVTATDMMVLAGAQPSAARRLYGAEPVRGRLGPEGGLRILLAAVALRARAHGRRIAPLLAYVGDHHVRAYVRVAAADPSADPVGLLDPRSFEGPPLSAEHPVGPMWTGPLFDPALLARLRPPPTAERPGPLATLLARCREESDVPVPFYYEPNELAARLRLPEPPARDRLLTALREAGHRAARTHARPEGIRTDAPRSEVERLARAPPRVG